MKPAFTVTSENCDDMSSANIRLRGLIVKKRFCGRAAGFVGVIAVLCSTFAAAQEEKGDWPMAGGDPGHSGWQKNESILSPDNIAASFKFLWKIKLGEPTGERTIIQRAAARRAPDQCTRFQRYRLLGFCGHTLRRGLRTGHADLEEALRRSSRWPDARMRSIKPGHPDGAAASHQLSCPAQARPLGRPGLPNPQRLSRPSAASG